MKSNVVKANKSPSLRKQKKPSGRSTTDMQSKIKQSFAQQVAAFIERYRPALEALAKR